MTDPIHNPAHYTAYPVQPIEISRHLGFCLGNAVKYVLRAPYKGGVEDCDKALKYLFWENEQPQAALSIVAFDLVDAAVERLRQALFERGNFAGLASDIDGSQDIFLEQLVIYLRNPAEGNVTNLVNEVTLLRRALALRDKNQDA